MSFNKNSIKNCYLRFKFGCRKYYMWKFLSSNYQLWREMWENNIRVMQTIDSNGNLLIFIFIIIIWDFYFIILFFHDNCFQKKIKIWLFIFIGTW